MDCPNCQAPQPEPPPRFCAACGLSTGAGRVAAKPAPGPLEVRCPQCGLLATAAKCRGCGSRVRWPEGVSPPDEK